ncbi:MAG: hypothetical protein U1E28_05080 [Beijerinckiaceae bacterium]
MKKTLLPFAAVLALSAFDFAAISVATVAPAEAAACVRGVRGAACAGPRGAVAVRRPPVYRRGVVVVR